MENLNVVITIPIYKEVPSPNEILAFKQGIKIFKNRCIRIFAPEGLSLKNYIDLCSNDVDIKIIFFKSKYFQNVEGYNKLLLSKEFYESFVNNSYLLIYQLDAYVFQDDLQYWCSKGYDYIGAPWFEGYVEKDNHNFLGVGNGGFSLRKISAMVKVLDHWHNYLDMGSVLKSKYITRNSKIKLILFYLFKRFSTKIENLPLNDFFVENEDYVWGHIFSNELNLISTPTSLLEASNFAFEVNSEYLFEINNKKLPFGCHGWYKHDTSFWENFIKIDSELLKIKS